MPLLRSLIAITAIVVATGVGVQQRSPLRAQTTLLEVGPQLSPVGVSAALDPANQSINVVLANPTGDGVVAFTLQIDTLLSNGKTKTRQYSMDFSQTPVGASNRGILAGNQRTFAIGYATPSNVYANSITITPRAFVFEDNTSVGNESSITEIFARREVNRRAFEEAGALIASILQNRPHTAFEDLLAEIGAFNGEYIKPTNAVAIVNEMRAIKAEGASDLRVISQAAVKRTLDRANKSRRSVR